MKKFPKKIFLTATENDDGSIEDFFVDLISSDVSNREEEGVEVAVYELVKLGVVKKSSRIVFE